MARESSFCYSDVSQQIQAGFESNPSEVLVNLTTGMEMIGFAKNHHHLQNHESSHNTSVMWKGLIFDNKTATNNHNTYSSSGGGGPSSSKAIEQSTTTNYYQHEQNHENLITEAVSWQEANRSSSLILDDSTGLRCVFNERPSQGLSLSLSSTDPSSIGLQSFELKHAATATSSHIVDHLNPVHEEMRFMDSTTSNVRDHGFLGKSPASLHQQQVLQDGFFQKFTTLHQYHHLQQQQQQQLLLHQGQFQLRNSKYLAPTKQLLNEFCSLGPSQITDHLIKQKKNKLWGNDGDDENGGGSSSGSSKNKSLYSLEFMELQKRKRKLLSMLDEVERRYRHYCDQMKAVVSSFEAIAGSGAASVYSALASKAMSRHFRNLKDGIGSQINETKKAMGEKGPAAPGTTKGETPRLRIIDQTLRQQKAFQQMTMIESHPWRPQRGLPERSVSILRAWLFEHFLHPYPSDVDKHILARQTGLSRSQVSNWFINARVRLWKPMVEEMYNEETKEQEDINNVNIINNTTNLTSSDGIISTDHLLEDTINIVRHEQKPTHDQLVRIDSECLSSIITNHNPDKNKASRSPKPYQNPNILHHSQQFGGFGAVELDFSSYNHHTGTEGVNYGGNGSSGGGVSLTLGLQQHHHHGGSGGGHGVSLAFSPNSSQSSLFYSRDHIEDCPQVHEYSILDGDQGQALPYRNLMGAQLLHDLAG